MGFAYTDLRAGTVSAQRLLQGETLEKGSRSLDSITNRICDVVHWLLHDYRSALKWKYLIVRWERTGVINEFGTEILKNGMLWATIPPGNYNSVEEVMTTIEDLPVFPTLLL